MVPLSGGETVYLKAGFGDLVSFIFSWLRAVVLGPTRWEGKDSSSLYLIIIILQLCLPGSGQRQISSPHPPDIHQALLTSGLTVEWAEKIVAVVLMGKY